MESGENMMEQSNEGFILSPQQKLQWRLGESEPHNMPFIVSHFTSRKEIDIKCLMQAIKQAVSNYEIFSLRLENLPELAFPFQIIDSKVQCEISHLDWQSLPESEFEHRIQQLVTDSTTLSSIYCIEDAQNRCHLVVKASSLLMDAASHSLLLQEITSCYLILKAEKADEDDDPVQYLDVSQYYNELLASDTEGREYWKDTLDRSQQNTSLHSQKLLSQESDFSSDFINLSLPKTLNQSLTNTKQDIEALLFGCWGVLISRLSIQKNIDVGIW